MLKFRIITFFLVSFCILKVTAQDYKKVIAESTDYAEIEMAYLDLMRSFGPQRIDSVTFYADEAIRYFQEQGYAAGECNFNLNMANVMMFNGGLAEAESYCKEAIRIAEEEGLPIYLARGYDFMTVIYGKRGALVKSTEYAYKALRANEALDDKRGIISSYIKLSAISLDMQKPDETLIFAQIADSINKTTINDVHLATGILSNKGVAYKQLEQLDDAMETFNEVYTIVLNNPEIERHHIPSALHNIGGIHVAKEDYQEAISYFNRSLEESIKYNLPALELRNKFGLASAFSDLKSFEESNNQALTALEESRVMNFSDIEIDLLELIANNFKQLNDWPNALEYNTTYYDKLIALGDKQNATQIKELESVYRLEKTEEELKIANALSASRTKQRDISFVFSIAILCFMLVLIVAYRRIRQLNRQNEITKKQLAESNRVKDKLFSIIGHDLRGTFSGTLGILDLIKEKQIPEQEVPGLVEMVINESKSTLETLDNLLMWGFTQIKSGQQIHLTHFDAFGAVDKNITFHSGRIRQKNITVRNLIPEDLNMTADENHFQLITRNLISNAIKFTPEHGEIIVGYNDQLEDFHEFYVKDNGAGIAEDRLDKMFTPLTQSTYGTDREKGPGLGLLLCKEFIALSGGRIWVESKQGEGSVFYFTLPEKSSLYQKTNH